MKRTQIQLTPVERDEIPAFTSDQEEREFWDTHSFGPGMLSEMQPVPLEGDDMLPPARSRTTPVPIRFGDDVIARAKALAATRHIGYQTLIKEFVTERLYEEEKRAGLR